MTHSIYALRALLNALEPLIGAEHELGGKAVSSGWADNASKDQIKEWGKKGTELVKEEMERVIEEACSVEYGRLMHKVRFHSIVQLARDADQRSFYPT